MDFNGRWIGIWPIVNGSDISNYNFTVIEQIREIAEAAGQAILRFYGTQLKDGTKEFIKKTGSFTVNIGLVENGVPVLGIVHVPVSGLTYGASAETGAWRAEAGAQLTSISTVVAPAKLRIVASRDHAGPEVKALLAKFPDAECLSIGSSLKFCLVAEGAADIYLRDVPTMEWDTAAAQAIVTQAGGQVLTHPAHEPLGYGKPDYRNGALLTIGDRALLGRL